MLTDARCRNARPDSTKPIRLHDEKGLYLELSPAGGRWWRFKFRFAGKEKRLSLGTYPETSLATARQRRDDARRLLADGVDPSVQRRQAKVAAVTAAESSLEVVAREWMSRQRWVPEHGDRVSSALQRDIFSTLGHLPVAAITAPEILACLRKVEARGTVETARRELQWLGQIFRFGVATGRLTSDPTRDLRGALGTPETEHFAAITDPKELGRLLRLLDSYTGRPATRAALRLAPLVFVRPGELRQAKWQDIDLDAAEWRFEASKTQQAHVVPLSTQAVAILRELQPVTGGMQWAFPGRSDVTQPLAESAVLRALRSLGVPKELATGHGFRATARTLLDEALGFAPHLIEHQLAHSVRDPLGRSYNRTQHLDQRRAMMQAWSDYLDQLRAGAKVIQLRA